jgi:hypothetical protein
MATEEDIKNGGSIKLEAAQAIPHQSPPKDRPKP